MKNRFVIAGGLTAAIIVSAANAGGPIEWATAADGDWGVPANWTPASVPGMNDAVLLGLSGPYTVTAAVSQSAASISITNPQAILRVSGFRTLSVFGDVFNDGLIVVNWNGINTTTRMRFDASATLDGGGTLRLANSNTAAELGALAGMVVTHGANHTIDGRGRITAELINNGTIRANDPASALVLTTGDKINNAQMIAENGATLDVTSITIDQSGGGTMTASGAMSVVSLSNATVRGGVVEGAAGGGGRVASNSTADDAEFRGQSEVAGFRTLTIESGIANNGVLTVNPTLINTSTSILLTDGANITGTGTVVLSTPGTTSELRSTGAGVPIHGASHTIRGRGLISAVMINAGAIRADVAGQDLILSTQDKTNTGLMRAENGGTLEMQSIIISQVAPGSIAAVGAGSTAELAGVSIFGGSLGATNGGLVSVALSSSVADLTMSGPSQIQGFRTLDVSGTLVHNGVMTVNPALINTTTGVRFADGSLLTGNGRIVLSNNSVTSLVSSTSGSFTQDADHTIEGRGRISAAMTNNGAVRANQAGLPMEIEGAAKTNNGLMRAESGGILNLLTTTIDQGPNGRIVADGVGSSVDLTNSTVNGGTLEASNGGLVRVLNGNGTVAGTAISGRVDISGFRALSVGASTVNNGLITVNSDGINTSTFLRFTGDHTLGGNGTIRLANTNSTATIDADIGVTLATLGAGQRLEGIGRVSVPLEMRGTLAPGLSVGTLNATQSIEMTPTATFEAEVSAPETADRLASTSEFVADGTLDVRFIDGFNPAAYWGATIVTATQGVSGRFDTILAPVPADSRLAVRARYLPDEIRIGAVCKPDINFDGQLNFFDISAFIALYNVQDPDADVAAPFGVWNFFDIAAYIGQYNAGCP